MARDTFHDRLVDGHTAPQPARSSADKAHEIRAEAGSQIGLGDSATHSGDAATARVHYESARGLYSEISDRRGEVNAALRLGELERVFGDPVTAREHYSAALDLCETLNDQWGKANALFGLAGTERLFGDPATAYEHYESALKLFQEVGNPTGEANARRGLGQIEQHRGTPEAASEHYEAALALFADLGDRLGLANTELSLGELAFGRGDPAGARARYHRALDLFKETDEPLGQANAYSHLGDVERVSGDINQARTHYETALGLYESLGEELGQGNTHRALGEFERVVGDPAAARRHLQAAIALYASLGSPGGTASAHMSLGGLENLFGNPTEARHHFEQGQALFEELEDTLGLAGSQFAFGTFLLHNDDPEGARLQFENALALYGALNNSLGKANTHQHLGMLNRVFGDAAEAGFHLEAAVTLYAEIGDRLGEANVESELGELNQVLGNAAAARKYYERALFLYRELGSRLGEAQTQSSWARLAQSVGDLPGALALSLGSVRCLEQLRAGLGSEESRQRFRERFARHYTLALDLAAAGIARRRTGAGEMALEVVEAARSSSLAELLRAGGFAVTGDAGSLLEQIVSLEAELLVAAPSITGRTSDVSSKPAGHTLAELTQLHERLAEVVSSSFASTFRPGRPDVTTIIPAIREEGCHVLLYNLDMKENGSAEGHVVWVAPSGEVAVRSLSLGPALIDFLARFEQGESLEVVVGPSQSWAALGAALIPYGLQHHIAESGETLSLVVVPDQVTQALPFCALRLKDGSALIERALVRTVPSLGLFVALKEAPSGKREGTVAHFDTATLGTKEEADAVGVLGGVFAPVTSTITRKDLLAAFKSPQMLWALGVHADEGEGLSQSIRLVSSEILSAGALLGQVTPTIVTLGSCFGARLPLGLATVCLTQGTRTVLGPLLDVDDPVASEILANTYAKLTTLPPAEALRYAQLSYLSSHPDAPPRGWGILVALGV